ncbi:MAG: 4-hydroxy-tetrahydrodipicolinate reductase [Bacteroidales bacterium]|nr:4-hydroxy-tetrahydrodipicolinate reductase [Candidatus Colimorpha onthohippi]
MKIALIGYGKMGHAIELLASQRGHQVQVAIDNVKQWSDNIDQLRLADVAVEFSTPDSAVDNIQKCFEIGLPVVVGTTGWYNQLDAVVAACKQCAGSLFVASNFSIGMNIMFDLNRRLAKLMSGRPQYTPSIAETHHIHKLDAPSGTAITLAQDIVGGSVQWVETPVAVSNGSATQVRQFAAPQTPLAITSYREGEIPGTHEVVYDSAEDVITISHRAKSRQGLAMGALIAAEFLYGKKGYYTMNDLLNIE